MTEQIIFLNSWVGLGSLFVEVSLVILILFFIYLKTSSRTPYGRADLLEKEAQMPDYLKYFTNKNILFFIFIFSLFSSSMTLYYSEILGVVPCAFCWFGRIFMYGIVIISGTALFKSLTPRPSPQERGEVQKEQKNILKYILNFSVLGAAVSLYHHVLQMTASTNSHLPCPASGGDCAKRIIFEYGHITFPWMAFILFVLFIVLILCVKDIDKNPPVTR